MPSPPFPTNAAPSRHWFARFSDAAWTRLILALGFLVFLPSIDYQFVYDDTALLLLNPWMDSWRSAAKLVSHHMWASAAGSAYYPANFYRPVFMLWLLFWNRISGGVPGFFHLANIVLHLIVVLLVIAIVRHLTRDRACALLAGFFFAVHPIHIEAVAWVSGATELLCAAFVLGSVLALLLGEVPSAHPLRYRWISLVLFALALFTKETAIVTPFALLPYLWIVAPLHEKVRRSLRAVAPYLGIIAIYLAIRLRVLGRLSESHLSSPRSALLGFALRFAWYARQLLWPFHLSVQYKPLVISGFSTGNLLFLLLVFLVAFLFVAWKVRQSPSWTLLGSLSFLSLCPVLLETFTGFQDRYLYLPSVGFCALLACGITRFGNRQLPATHWLRGTAIFAIALICCVTVLREERIWDDDLSLFQRANEVNPSPETLAQLSAIYGDRHDPRDLTTLQQGVQKFPESALLWQKLGLYYIGHNQSESAAIDALRRSQNFANSKILWGQDECALGMLDYNRGDLPQAEQELRAGLESDARLQECRSTLALLLNRTGRATEAQQQRALLP